MTPFRGPWVRPDGVVVAEDLADFSNEQLLAGINLTNTLSYVNTTSLFDGVWSNGVAPNQVQETAAVSCTAWQNAGQRSRVAYFGRTRDFYSTVYERNCDTATRFYCISTEAVY